MSLCHLQTGKHPYVVREGTGGIILHEPSESNSRFPMKNVVPPRSIAYLIKPQFVPPFGTPCNPRTVIWLEQKLFWVFGFKSFIMLIEMQNRVGFSKILWKTKNIYILCCSFDMTHLDIEPIYTVEKWILCYNQYWGRCGEMFVKRFRHFYASR